MNGARRLTCALTTGIALLFAGGTPTTSALALPPGNALANPGAEEGSGGSFGAGAGPPPGWTTTGQFTSVAYSSSVENPPPPFGGGDNFFWAGNGGTATAQQEIDLSADAGAIDSDTVSAGLSAFMGGYLAQDDEGRVEALFLNAAGATLGKLELPTVAPAERGNRTVFVGRAQDGPVPPCTRRAQVRMVGTKRAGAESIDAYFDNVSLTFAVGPARGAACNPPVVRRRPRPHRSITQPRGSCGNTPDQRVCVDAPLDIRRLGCLRQGSFVHRFKVKLKVRRGGLIVNRRSRVQIVRFRLDRQAGGSDRRRPYYMLVDGSRLTPGAHVLSANVRLKVPRREQYFRKRLRFGFNTCA